MFALDVLLCPSCGGRRRIVGVYTLMQVAEGHWRGIDAAELVPLVRAGVVFEDGVQTEPQQKKRTKAAA